MGRITQQPNQSFQLSEAKPICVEKIKEIKQIPLVEKPVAVHNLSEQVVINKPILPSTPIIIEIDPVTVPQMIITEKPLSSSINSKIEEIANIPEVNVVVKEPIKIEIKEPINVPVSLTLQPTIVAVSPIIENKSSFVLPDINKSAIYDDQCLGRKLVFGDIVDGDILPPSDKKWNPDSKNKTIRWFDMQWKSDDNYELINWCVFATHMELELKKI